MSDKDPFDIAFELGYRKAQIDQLLDSIESKLDALIVASTPSPSPTPKVPWWRRPFEW